MSTSSTPLAAPKISHPVFLGFLWSGTGLSLSFVIFRLIVKIRSYKKVYSDDYLVVAAWILLLGSAVLWQFMSPNLYDLFAVTSGKKPLTPDFISENADLLRSITPFSLLFYSCLWTVKLSFLLFFRRLGLNVRGQKIWWWCVLTITVLTWIATVADHDYKCSLRPLTWIWVHCQSPSAIRFTNNTYYANCAADVVTDCLIISIPVRMLWNVRLPLRQKVLLMTIFSLTVIVMIVSIIRVAIVGSSTRSSTQQPDISWVYFWSNIEMSTAIVIACIGSFRQVFVNAHNRRRQDRRNRPSSFNRLFPWLRFPSWSKRSPLKRSPKSSKGQDSSQDWRSPTHIAPLQSIHIDPHISVAASNFRLEDY
ncbi:MAG: hypothetical protein LQ349_006051 [Xanthoria aureola]|nr:MAG: hypothetical protein LQ349_006051 [Xanthoria aureola]